MSEPLYNSWEGTFQPHGEPPKPLTLSEVLGKIAQNSGMDVSAFRPSLSQFDQSVDPNWNDAAKIRAMESGALGPEVQKAWAVAKSGAQQGDGTVPGMSIYDQSGRWLLEMLISPNPRYALDAIGNFNASPNAKRAGDVSGFDRIMEGIVLPAAFSAAGGAIGAGALGAGPFGAAAGGAGAIGPYGGFDAGALAGLDLGGSAAAGGTGALTGGASAAGGGITDAQLLNAAGMTQTYTPAAGSLFDAGAVTGAVPYTDAQLLSMAGITPTYTPGALTTAGLNDAWAAGSTPWLSNAPAGSVFSFESGVPTAGQFAPQASSGVLEKIISAAKEYGAPAKQVMGWVSKAANGDASGLKDLLKLGIPAALIAGLFENNKSPLTDNMRIAADRALASTAKYDALGAIPQTESEKRAIELANANVGNYQPYIDRAGVLADTAAAGVTDEQRDRYMNPYIDGVLKNTIRDIEEAAGRKREQLKAITSMSGNDLGSYGVNPTRFNVEDSLLDRETLRTVGDASAKLRMGAFDSAMGYANKDLDRNTSSSNIYAGLGKAAGALGATDVESLKTAGALERRPLEDERKAAGDAARLYTGVVHGTAPALSATTPDSLMGKAAGALTTLKGAKDIGLYD